MLMVYLQRTHSASILAAPKAYEAEAEGKKKGQKIIDIECRGLEFTEFKADVGPFFFFSPSCWSCVCVRLTLSRANGRQRVSSLLRRSRALNCLKASGMIMMRRLGMRLLSRRFRGRLVGPDLERRVGGLKVSNVMMERLVSVVF
jgi:hypothetical protein